MVGPCGLDETKRSNPSDCYQVLPGTVVLSHDLDIFMIIDAVLSMILLITIMDIVLCESNMVPLDKYAYFLCFACSFLICSFS